jgi:hypothetical protein
MEDGMWFSRKALALAGVLLFAGLAAPTMASGRDHAASMTGVGGCVAVCVLTVDEVAEPAEGAVTIAPECAAKELRVVTWIEQHGEAGDVPSGHLAEAAFAMFDARAACRAGRVTEALAGYERILRDRNLTITGTD